MADATRPKKETDFKTFVTEKFENQDAIMQEIFSKLQSLNTKYDQIISQYSQTSTGVIQSPKSGEYSSSIRTTNLSFGQTLKLKFPNFNGEDPNSWIYKAEQYFEYQKIIEGHQVQLASFHLEGTALQ